MEMILRRAEVNTNEITGPSMKSFMDDITLARKIQITYETTSDQPTGALKMGCGENKAFKVP